MPGHPVEQRRREAAVAEQMVVEEVQVPPGNRSISASASSTRWV
jgi:hypothetical protein